MSNCEDLLFCYVKIHDRTIVSFLNSQARMAVMLVLLLAYNYKLRRWGHL